MPVAIKLQKFVNAFLIGIISMSLSLFNLTDSLAAGSSTHDGGYSSEVVTGVDALGNMDSAPPPAKPSESGDYAIKTTNSPAADNQTTLPTDGANADKDGKIASQAQKDRVQKLAEENLKKRDLAAKKARERAAASNLSPADAANVQADRPLVQKALEDLKKGRLLELDQAKQARDAEIRKNLILLSDGQKKDKEFKAEDARLTAQIAELGGLAAKLMTNSKGMDSAPQANGAVAPVLKAKNEDRSNISSEQPQDHEEPKVATSPELEKLKALIAEMDPTGKLLAGKDAKTRVKMLRDYSLKKSLTAKLKADEKAAAAKAAGAASLAGSASDQAKEKDRPANAVAEAFLGNAASQDSYAGSGAGAAYGSGSNHGFSLSGSETTAEVNRMISTLDGQSQAAADEKAGILETDSPSLFERVHSAVNSCLKQGCVVTKRQ